MFTRKSRIHHANYFKDEKLKTMNEQEAKVFKQNYPMLPNSVLSQVIKIFQESNIHSEIVGCRF